MHFTGFLAVCGLLFSITTAVLGGPHRVGRRPTKRTSEPHVAVPVPVRECQLTHHTDDYMGRTTTTVSGATCQHWNSQSPHPHDEFKFDYEFPDESVDAAENFCRNSGGGEPSPWCYTSDPNIEWEYCDIDMCSGPPILLCPNRVFATLGDPLMTFRCTVVASGGLTVRTQLDGQDYLPSGSGPDIYRYQLDATHHELTVYIRDVSAADLQTYTFQLSTTNSTSPSLSTPTSTSTATYSVQVVQAPSDASTIECLTTDNGVEYTGTKSTTLTGRMCQKWALQTPHEHGYDRATNFHDVSLEAAAGYCRNPRESGNGRVSARPWCYTQDPNRRWEFCSIDSC